MAKQREQREDGTIRDDLGDTGTAPDEGSGNTGGGDAPGGADEERGPFNPSSRGDESGEVY
jgi:hypothetical protein